MLKQKIEIKENLKPLESWITNFVVPHIIEKNEAKILQASDELKNLGYAEDEQTTLVEVNAEIGEPYLNLRSTKIFIATAHAEKEVTTLWEYINYVDPKYTKTHNAMGVEAQKIALKMLEAGEEQREAERRKHYEFLKEQKLEKLAGEVEEKNKMISKLKAIITEFVKVSDDDLVANIFGLDVNSDDDDYGEKQLTEVQEEALSHIGVYP